jgi:hypothetical protein
MYTYTTPSSQSQRDRYTISPRQPYPRRQRLLVIAVSYTTSTNIRSFRARGIATTRRGRILNRDTKLTVPINHDTYGRRIHTEQCSHGITTK